MSIFRPIVLFIAVLSGLLAPPLRAAVYGSVTVREIQWIESRADRTAHGYVEYRFRVTNQDTKAHRVDLSMPRSAQSSGSTALDRSTNGLEVPPQSTVVMRLLQPPVEIAAGSSEVQVSIDGRIQQNSTLFTKNDNHFQRYSNRGNDHAHVLVSLRIPPNIRDLFRTGKPTVAEAATLVEKTVDPETGDEEIAAPPAVSVAVSPPAEELNAWLATVPVEEWSDSWLAYTRFDAVTLTDEDWRRLQDRHAPVLDALRKYVEAGGVLAVIGTDWTAPKEWSRAENSDRLHQAVFGIAYTMDDDLERVVMQVEPFRQLALNQMKSWRTAFGDSGVAGRHGGPWHHGGASGLLGGDTSLFQSMPVVAEYGVSVKRILILIVVFAILIGPVNIYVLSLLKRRIWLLWTVPATSLAAALLVLGASFFQEGWLRQSSSATYTVLDQRREEATSFGFVGYYSTLTPRGILFSPDTEATACMDRGYYGDARSLELNLLAGGNQFFSRGWIQARVPCYLAVRKAQSHRKERVAFDWTAEPPTATNGLGVDVKRLDVRSPEGKMYTIDDFQAGSRVSMQATETRPDSTDRPDSPAAAMRKLRESYDRILQSGPGVAALSMSSGLPLGAYLAEIESWNPFIEPGIDRMTPYQNKTTIYGIY